MRRTLVFVVLLLSVACASQKPFHLDKAKQLEFTLVEDYDKGSDLSVAAADFATMKDLGIHTWRGSFGWDDYEPEPGKYDFDWLKQFVSLARDNGIMLRPYIAYTPEWAGRHGSDDKTWNDPPADPAAWRDFVTQLATALEPYHDVLSYEIYNEENTSMWWEGDVRDYIPVLEAASSAIRGVDPNVQVVMGGLVWPDTDWLESVCGADASTFDVAAIHAYPETSTEPGVEVENYLGTGYGRFDDSNRSGCGGKPIWINEAGFATTPGKSERDQANWWARAIATFAAAPDVTQIGVYEIKDLPAGEEVIGTEANHYLGILHSDRTPKLAYKTLKMLIPLMSDEKITVDHPVARIGQTKIYRYIFTREDGRRILFVWNRSGVPFTVNVKLDRPAHKVTEYFLDGHSEPYRDLNGKKVLHAVKLGADVRIFEIRP